MRDASEGLESTIWLLRTLSQHGGVTYLYREQPLGTFTEIGPATPDPTIENQSKYSYIGASSDLSHVFFSTEPEAPNLRWPFDTTTADSATLYEYQGTGNTQPALVGVDNSGNLVSRCGARLGSSTPETRRGSMYNAVSGTGARVFFTATGRDDHECLGGSSSIEPPVDELFAREELPKGGSVTIPISEESFTHCSEAPSIPCADANFEGAARDGSSVFFTSTQKLSAGASEDSASADSASVGGCSQTTEPGGCNLYEYDFQPVGHGLSVVATGAPESEGPQVQGVARISENGTHVYFVAKGALTQAPNGLGQKAKAGQDNLYLSVRECSSEGVCASSRRIVFVTTLASSDREVWSQRDERPVLASRDGRFLVFTSGADLLGEGITTGVRQVFQYNASTNTLVRASIGQDGYNNNGKTPVYGAAITISSAPYGSRTTDNTYSASDSPAAEPGILAPEDGAVFFQSADALTPQALADQVDQHDLTHEPIPNIYEYRAGKVYLISDGLDTSSIVEGSSVGLIGWSASGDDVFFTTADALVPQDTDTQQDIYDAHVGGGFPAPASAPICTADGCHGMLAPAPSIMMPGSITQTPEASQPATSAPIKPQRIKTKGKPKARKKKKRNARHPRHVKARNAGHIGHPGRSAR